MIYFLIRHKATSLFMPQAKRDRGYSHWNPAVNTKYIDGGMKAALPVPRLIDTRARAARCITHWAINPNARNTSRQSYDGEWDDLVVTKDDGRKKEDLEVVEVDIVLKEDWKGQDE